MQRDMLLRNPRLSRNILIAGAAVYFLACIPLYGRRGFPEVDPFWLAMVWLWIPALPLSAIHDAFDRKRVKYLLGYILVAGFIMSWSTLSAVPSYKNPVRALLELPVFAVLMLPGVLVVEAASRAILLLLRGFFTHPYCGQCGYHLHGLPEPRCPECGTTFAAEALDPSYSPTATPVLRRRTTILVALIVILTLALPFAHRHHIFASVAISGQESAEEDWANGKAKWFVSKEELEAMRPEQQERFYNLMFETDPASGLQIERQWRDWQNGKWQTSYRQTIERKLRESGRSRPSFQ